MCKPLYINPIMCVISESEHLSDDSETFHEIMAIFQNEVKHRKQARVRVLIFALAH